MRRMGPRFNLKKPWKPEQWLKAWEERGPKEPSFDQLLRRAEIENFRMALALKEPKQE